MQPGHTLEYLISSGTKIMMIDLSFASFAKNNNYKIIIIIIKQRNNSWMINYNAHFYYQQVFGAHLKH